MEGLEREEIGVWFKSYKERSFYGKENYYNILKMDMHNVNVHLLSPLDFVKHQKAIHDRMFDETVRARKLRNDGDVSIAAARGILKMVSSSNGIGYNGRMKSINDRMTMQIINKYKTGFMQRLSLDSKRGRDLII